jgi:hypothetical protein
MARCKRKCQRDGFLAIAICSSMKPDEIRPNGFGVAIRRFAGVVNQGHGPAIQPPCRRKQPTLQLGRDSRVAAGVWHDTLAPFRVALAHRPLRVLLQLLAVTTFLQLSAACFNAHFHTSPHITRAPHGLVRATTYHTQWGLTNSPMARRWRCRRRG